MYSISLDYKSRAPWTSQSSIAEQSKITPFLSRDRFIHSRDRFIFVTEKKVFSTLFYSQYSTIVLLVLYALRLLVAKQEALNSH